MTTSSPQRVAGPRSEGEGLTRLASTVHWLSLVLLALSIVALLVTSDAPSLLFVGVEMLLIWSAVVAVIQNLSFRFQGSFRLDGQEIPPTEGDPVLPRKSRNSFRAIWQWFLVLAGLVFLLKIAYPGMQHPVTLALIPIGELRLAAVSLLASAGVLYFFTNYASIVTRDLQGDGFGSFLRLCWTAACSCAAAAMVTFGFISTGRDYSTTLGWGLIGLTLALSAEPWARFAARFFLPPSQRGTPAIIGESLLLDLTFGSTHGILGLKSGLENLLGTKLRDVWLWQFLQQTAGPVVLAGLILGWLSTCVTAVPLGSRGVLVSLGRFMPTSLDPGLHLSWPWPLGEIDIIQTEQIREVSLGFDQDLAGPLLWTERHFAGEQNLLVGDGESLLTVDVPIQYRISDAVAFAAHATDPAAALKSLAERQLIQAARSRESFDIMTVDREKMAADIKQGLQADVARLGLGIEVVFVGLRDVHPPVDVAPAYERVISAQEQKETSIDLARVYEASVLPEAQAAAQRLIAEADAARTGRLDQATGDSTRFTSLLGAEQENPSLFRTRLRYDALDDGLAAPSKIIVGLSRPSLPASYLDLRSIKNTLDQTTLPVPEQPQQPARSGPRELPDE